MSWPNTFADHRVRRAPCPSTAVHPRWVSDRVSTEINRHRSYPHGG